ncbi:unnamed protein product [Parajaminaea phylloscopi]
MVRTLPSTARLPYCGQDGGAQHRRLHFPTPNHRGEDLGWTIKGVRHRNHPDLWALNPKEWDNLKCRTNKVKRNMRKHIEEGTLDYYLSERRKTIQRLDTGTAASAHTTKAVPPPETAAQKELANLPEGTSEDQKWSLNRKILDENRKTNDVDGAWRAQVRANDSVRHKLWRRDHEREGCSQ